MRRTMKRLTSVLLSTAMLLSSVQTVLAAKVDEFVDFPTGWSRPAMEAAVDNGLLSGFGNGEIKPKNNLTRAEAATITAQAFGAVNMANLSAYKDVPYDAWYYEYIAKAVQMGALAGKSETEMCPEDSITREEVFSLIARTLALSEEDTSVLSKFADADEISSWASSTLAAMVKRGYVNGDDHGCLNPKAYITREEFAQVMYMTIKRYITTPGTYNEDMQGIVVLRAGNVALTSMSINGDLVVGDGAARLAVKLTNVNINGRLLTRGGTMTLKNTTTTEGVVVFNPNGITHFNNYRTEAVFDGIRELTRASFLSGSTIQTGGSSSGSSSGSVSYYVTFKVGDTEYAKVSVRKGNKIGDAMPTDPSKTGYTFDGWYDQNGDRVTGDTVVMGAMTVTARFARVDYPIYFKNRDGSNVAFVEGYTPANTYNKEETYTLPGVNDVKKRKGYTFKGWEDEHGNPVTEVKVTEATTAAGLTLYPRFEANEYTLRFSGKFKDGSDYKDVTYTIENYDEVVFPTGAELVVPDGKDEFLGWYLDDRKITTLDEDTFVTDTVGTITLTAEFSDSSTPPPGPPTPPSPTSYMVTFKCNADDTPPYYHVCEVVSGERIGAANMPTPEPSKTGYKFEGWFDGETEITADTVVTAAITAIAKFPLIQYPIYFKNRDGSDVAFVDGRTPANTYNAVDTYTLPGVNDVKKRKGYTFKGWEDEHGNPVTEVVVTDATTAAGLTLYPRFTENVYTLFFDADFIDGENVVHGRTTTYTVSTLADVAFPDASKVKIPDGKDAFLGWYLREGDREITALDEDTFITDTVGTITLTAKFSDSSTPNPPNPPTPGEDTITVKFYRDYDKNGVNEDYLCTKTLNLDSTGVAHIADVELSDVKSLLGSGRRVFRKSYYMPTSYLDYDSDNNDYYVLPTFWYEVNGKLVPFNTSVALTQDTKVHVMFQNFAFKANLTGLPAAMIETDYADESRLVDSAKVMGHNAVKWIEVAQLYPKYTELTGAAYDKLAALNIIDEDKNIKMLYIPISISTFTTKEVANGMVKARIRDMITDPAQLDTLLGMVDIDDLVAYIDKDAVIEGLTDAQIAELMKADENRAMVTSFIMSDLHSTDSVLMDTVLEYIGTALAADGDANDTFRNKLAGELKDKLEGSDASAKKLRELIIKSGSFKDMLTNDAIKEKVIDLALDTDSGVIDAILDDGTLAQNLIERLAVNDKFVEKVVATGEFKSYVLSYIRKGGDGYDPVTNVILDSTDAKGDILDAVEADEGFMDLLENNTALSNEVLNSITVDVDDVVEYVFEIDDATNYEDIISMDVDDVNEYFRTNVPGFSVLATGLGSEKAAKNALYYGTDPAAIAARNTVKNEISSRIATYKENVLNSFIADTLADDDPVKGVIEEHMLGYVRKYVDKKDINNDDLEAIIESVILKYVSSLITGPAQTDDPTLVGVQTVLGEKKDEYIRSLYNDASKKTFMQEFVKEYINGSDTNEMRTLISGMYTDIVPTMAAYIQGLSTASANYTAIDNALKTEASSIDVDLLSTFIKTNASNSSVRALLEDYIADPSNERSLEAYVNDYIDTIDASFVHANRTLIDNMLRGFDIDELIGSDPDKVVTLVKEYINGLNASEKRAFADRIYGSISATPEYIGLLNNIFDDGIIEITDSNLALVTVLSYAISELTFDDAVDFTDNAYVEKIVNVLGKDFISDRFEETRDNYCDGLNEAIARVSSGASAREEYTTSLSFRVNPIKDVLVKLYDKAQPVVENKLKNANVRYDENDYLKYIVEHDVIARLVNESGDETDELTGYALRSEVDYASYMMELLIATDDAICWYGDNLTDEQLEAVCDAAFAKVQTVHKKLNELLEDYVATGDVPDKLRQVLDKVQKLNDIFVAYEPKLKNVIEKYLANDINDKIQNGTITDDERFTTTIDILLGNDDPVFTIDCLYDLFYKYDDKLQTKLKDFVDSGKLRAAIDKALDKAESTGAVSGRVDLDKVERLANELYAIIVKLADNGVEPFRVNTDDDATIIDEYELELGGNVFTMTRSLQ